MHQHGFTDGELGVLRQVCAQRAFIAACWRIRVQYERDQRKLPQQRPSLETKRYRALRRAFTQGWKPERRPALRSLDAAALALIDPTLRVWDEPHRSPRAALAFRALEQRARPNRYPDFAATTAAQRTRRLLEQYGLAFTDYDSAEHDTRGSAATVLRVVLGKPTNVRRLIRRALGKPG